MNNEYTFITLDMPVNPNILRAFEEELNQTCTQEQLDLIDEHLYQLSHDGYGSIRFQWRTDYDGNINAELAKMLSDWDDENFFYNFDVVMDICCILGEGFWDNFANTDCEEIKADLAKQHIEASLRYYPGDTPDDILQNFADCADYDASTIMAEVLFVSDYKEAA